MFNFFKRAWSTLPDPAKRVVHTFWQAFLAMLIASVTGLLPLILSVHNWNDVKSLFASFVTAIIAAALSAAKSSVTNGVTKSVDNSAS